MGVKVGGAVGSVASRGWRCEEVWLRSEAAKSVRRKDGEWREKTVHVEM